MTSFERSFSKLSENHKIFEVMAAKIVCLDQSPNIPFLKAGNSV